MTAAVLAQQADAGHIAGGLWVGLALVFAGGALILAGGVMLARQIIRWWERRGTTAGVEP